jgi:hypothetical protein
MKKLSIEKVEAALQRAAYLGLHGTKEQRSGRFMPKEELQPHSFETQKANTKLNT